MMVPQNVNFDILYLIATLNSVSEFKFLQHKQHKVILCRTIVSVCVYPTDDTIKLSEAKIPWMT
jgi:hypothetical protein